MDITGILAIGAIIYFFTRYQVSSVNYEIVTSYVKQWTYDGVTVYTDIEIKNGSDIPLSVDGFDGVVVYMGQEVAKVGLINKLSIPAGSANVITVGAKILYGPATAVILESIRTGQIESGVKMKGTIYAGKFKIPVFTNYKLW